MLCYANHAIVFSVWKGLIQKHLTFAQFLSSKFKNLIFCASFIKREKMNQLPRPSHFLGEHKNKHLHFYILFEISRLLIFMLSTNYFT